MGRGSKSAPGGKAPRKPPGPLGRLFLVFCRPLLEQLSLHSVFSCVGACIGFADHAVAALLVLTAPLSIPLLVWTALGRHSSLTSLCAAKSDCVQALVQALRLMHACMLQLQEPRTSG